MLPAAGGPYVYLRKAFGNAFAFLFGWTEFLVIRAGSVATLASAFALYCAQLLPPPHGVHTQIWLSTLAVGAMTLVAVINILGTKFGGGVQVVGTVIKLGALGAMMVLPFVLGQASVTRLTPVLPVAVNQNFVSGFMAAMVAVLWAYDGWVNSSEMAEEIKDPGRNIPRSLMLGMAIVMAVYMGMTLVYHMVLPMPEIIASAQAERGSPKVVAAVFCRHLFGAPGHIAISLVVMCSTLIALNGNAMSGPRAYFAMARDGLFPHMLGHVHRRFQTPANAIGAQAIWSIALTVLGTIPIVANPPTSPGSLPAPLLAAWTTLHTRPLYDVLYGYVIFGGTVIYTLTITSVFVLRYRLPDFPRPYRTWGYPLTPLVYVAASLYLMASMLQENSHESFAGLGIILLGLPAYFLLYRKRTDSVPA
jgi:APA family basic amino acid/polyamine antiporter